MNTLNHTLWGATIGMTVGMPLAGAVAGSIPDLFTAPGFGIAILHHRHLEKTSDRLLLIYRVLHNWWFGAGVTVLLFSMQPRLGVLGLCYFWHIFEDAFVHTDMATSFLFPVWKGKIRIVSAASHPWIQVADFLAILAANIVIFAFVRNDILRTVASLKLF